VTRPGRALLPGGKIAMSSSSRIHIVWKLRPGAGRVTSATSIALSSSAARMPGVLPVLTTISSAGNFCRSARSTGGSR
jgi:hypothetical protein